MRNCLFIDTHRRASAHVRVHAHRQIRAIPPHPRRSRECTLSREVDAEPTILRRRHPLTSRRQLAPGYSKIRYLRNYCINLERASEIWHGLSLLCFSPIPHPSPLPPCVEGNERSRYPRVPRAVSTSRSPSQNAERCGSRNGEREIKRKIDET